MDIQIYDDLKNCLTKFFANLDLPKEWNVSVVEVEPSQPTYPLLKFVETRNVPFEQHRHHLETVANLGYRVDVYAKSIAKNKTSKSTIARTIAKHCDDFLTMCKRLRQVSWNVFENDGVNGDLYHIVIMYSAHYYEQRRRIL